MGEILSNENEVGFLPHEMHFVLNAVHRATKALSDANKEYGGSRGFKWQWIRGNHLKSRPTGS